MEPRQEDQARLDQGAGGVSEAARVLPLEGVHNFRDYGGYPCAGGRLKTGLLFRSAQHHGATDGDLARIAGIGLASVIDLRGGRERDKAPCRRPEGFAAQVFFVDEDTTGIAPHMQAARDAARAAPSADQARSAMTRGYAGMAYRPHLMPMLRRYFAVLADLPGPSLIHCMAGKDRTGLAVALFHVAMGVHPDDLMADYLMTNSAGRAEERIAAGATHVRASYGGAIDDAAVRVLMMVEPAYLDAAFAAIAERSGSVDAYLRDELGVTGTMREALAARLIG
jgi:protein-tyrosine phosphatase